MGRDGISRRHHLKRRRRAPAGTCAWHARRHPTIAPLYMAVIIISDALKHLIEDVDAFLDLCAVITEAD
jgi:hypothetical protein